MEWLKGTAAASVSMLGQTFDRNRSEEGLTPLAGGGDEYIVVGAGPVGLWTAIQIKIRLPTATVVVYEKRTEYTRSHMIRLGSDALWWSVGSDEPEMKALIDVQSKGYGMQLRDLETLLRGLAERIEVNFIQRTILDGNELLSLHPEARAFIGADGRHSVLRETLLRPTPAEAADRAEKPSEAAGAAPPAESRMRAGAAPASEPEDLAAAAAAAGRLPGTSAAPPYTTDPDPLTGADAAAATAAAGAAPARADCEPPAGAGEGGREERLRDEFLDVRTLQHTVYINLDLPGDRARHQLEGGALQGLAFSAADSILHAGSHPVRLVVGSARER